MKASMRRRRGGYFTLHLPKGEIVSFKFDTKVQSFPVGATRRTEVKLGDVVMTFHGDLLYQIWDKRSKNGYYWRELPDIQVGFHPGLQKVSYQGLLFHLNQMLWEQAQSIVEPIMNEALAGKEEE